MSTGLDSQLSTIVPLTQETDLKKFTSCYIFLEEDVNDNHTTKPYNKRDDFDFPSTTSFTYKTIYHHHQLICYARACST